MTVNIDPGPGWQEITIPRATPVTGSRLILWNNDGAQRMWVPTVPPLPTEPYTVIETTGMQGHEQVWVLANGMWLVPGEETAYSPTELFASITGFEVLAQPQSVLDAAAEAFEEKLKRVRHETPES